MKKNRMMINILKIFFILFLETNVFTDTYDVIVTDARFLINNMDCALLGKPADNLIYTLGKPDAISPTFGGYDYIYDRMDINVIVNFDKIINSISFYFNHWDEGEQVCRKGKIDSLVIDDLTFSSESVYEEVLNTLKDKNIPHSVRRDTLGFIILIENYHGKYLYIDFFKNEKHKLHSIIIAMN